MPAKCKHEWEQCDDEFHRCVKCNAEVIHEWILDALGKNWVCHVCGTPRSPIFGHMHNLVFHHQDENGRVVYRCTMCGELV